MIKIINKVNFTNIKGDIYGGLTAAVIALPLALAFGVSSGAGAIAGLYGAILVGFFAALFGGTATQISGPTGPMSVVMALVLTEMIATHGSSGVVLAFSAVIFSGLFQILFGVFRLGKYFVMVPYPVISGFMTGIGIIIILMQIAPMLGVTGFSNALLSVKSLPDTLTKVNANAAYISISALIIMYFWPKKLTTVIPAPLAALIGLTFLSAWLTHNHYINDAIPVIGVIPTGFPQLIWPDLSFISMSSVLYYAFLLAVLGAIDSLLTSMVADAMTQDHHLSDKELIGQGIGNMIAGFFASLPGAGATMRTAINIRSGGRTALSGMVHSVALLIIVLWVGDYAQFIPNALLAGMLMKVGIDIIDWRFVKKLNKVGVFSASLMLLVLFLTVFVDLITAVLVGMFVANLVTLDRLANIQLDNIIFSQGETLLALYNNNEQPMESCFDPYFEQRLLQTLLIEIDGPVSFAVSRELARRCCEYSQFDTLIIDLSQAKLIGTTTSLMIIDLIEQTLSIDNEVLIVVGNEKVSDNLAKLGLNDLLSSNKQFISRESAMTFMK